MSGPTEQPGGYRNGQPLTYREFDAYVRLANEVHKDMSDRIRDVEKRTDRLESKWDRYVGPVVVLAGSLTVVATVSNIILILSSFA